MFVLAGYVLCAAVSTIEPDSPGPGDSGADGVGSAVTESVRPVDRRMAEDLIRLSRGILSTDPLTIDSWTSASEFLFDAARIDRDRATAWRLLTDIALEQDDQALLERALKHLVQLDPADTAVRLARLHVAVDRFQTAPQQIRMLEQLLEPARIAELSPEVAAELAIRLADLERQRGNSKIAEAWADRAVQLSPFNVSAVAMRMGASMDVNDPVAWAMDLVDLMRANPADRDTALQLGNVLLEHGDPRGAVRFLKLHRDFALASGLDPGADLDADLAIALMLSGELDQASEALAQRRVALDQMFKQITESSESRDTAVDAAVLRAPLPPKIAATYLVLASVQDQQASLDRAASDLVESIKWDRLSLEEAKASADIVARSARMALRLAVGTGVDISQLQALLKVLQELKVDVTIETELIAAELAAAEGRPEEAQSAFRNLSLTEDAARLALARHLLAQGERRDAAGALLPVHRTATGTLLGVLATLRLTALLGQPLPVESPGHEMQAISQSIASAWDRYGTESSLAMAMRIRPQRRTVDMFEPLIVNVELFNHLSIPLTIGPAGPINDLMVLVPHIQQPYITNIPQSPMVLDIGRRLRLQPHERITIPVDLREYWIGGAIDSAAMLGSTVEIEAVLNPRIATAAASGKPMPLSSALGMESSTGQIHVEGIRLTSAEIDIMTQSILRPLTDESIKEMAILGMLLFDSSGVGTQVPITDEQRRGIQSALAEVWPRLDSVQQGWLVSVIPISSERGAWGELVDDTSDPFVQRILLMRITAVMQPEEALDDPRLIRALRSGDPKVYALATWIEAFLNMAAESKLNRSGSGAP
jgi:tetratricopeptide (TPR) repeat protein